MGAGPRKKSGAKKGPIPLRGTVRVAAFDGTGRKGYSASVTTAGPTR